jgi:Fe-S-cluster containining protein
MVQRRPTQRQKAVVDFRRYNSPMSAPRRIIIAGLTIHLQDAAAVLADLHAVYDELANRGETYRADPGNPHLCRAGCSHCCRSGAVFAVTLAEAVDWRLGIERLPPDALAAVSRAAEALLAEQRRAFAEVDGPADRPGERDEALFSSRVSRFASRHPPCPLLADDLCSVYSTRPLLCRAYGFPVDAYAVRSDAALVFRSLCVLYEGHALCDYVRAEDLKARVFDLSRRLAGHRNLGRFTSIEAILARLE